MGDKAKAESWGAREGSAGHRLARPRLRCGAGELPAPTSPRLALGLCPAPQRGHLAAGGTSGLDTLHRAKRTAQNHGEKAKPKEKAKVGSAKSGAKAPDPLVQRFKSPFSTEQPLFHGAARFALPQPAPAAAGAKSHRNKVNVSHPQRSKRLGNTVLFVGTHPPEPNCQ